MAFLDEHDGWSVRELDALDYRTMKTGEVQEQASRDSFNAEVFGHKSELLTND
jgi:hypothetical protein